MRGKTAAFIHVYECLTKDWLQKQTVFTNRTQPLIITGLQYNASRVCGDSAPHVGHSTYLYPTSNLHISYFSWNYFVCVSGSHAIRDLSKAWPSGNIKNVSDLHSAPRTQVCVQDSSCFTVWKSTGKNIGKYSTHWISEAFSLNGKASSPPSFTPEWQSRVLLFVCFF